ncbi:peptidyl-tRNA hydrolase [Clostridia bacterium]|nr:peptidyl-tRNA hydrolase [Clostridia bacterium]
MLFFKPKAVVSGEPTHIICGLGNPGVQYENTRHNCGFLAVDTLCEKLGTALPKKLRFKSLTTDAATGGAKVFIMKPTTFMNLSGDAVVAAMQFYKIPPERVVIIFDDVSLPLGKIRIRQKGSDGGHNGMKNIIMRSGSDLFPRIKIGIDSDQRRGALRDFVTSPFKKVEGELLESALSAAADAAAVIVSGDIIAAMNRFN